MVNAVSEMVSRQRKLLEVQPRIHILKKGYRKLNATLGDKNPVKRKGNDSEFPSVVFTSHMRSKTGDEFNEDQEPLSPSKLSRPVLIDSTYNIELSPSQTKNT